jgi:hypothetical protein
MELCIPQMWLEIRTFIQIKEYSKLRIFNLQGHLGQNINSNLFLTLLMQQNLQIYHKIKPLIPGYRQQIC